ncbi:MAG: hypothetical protein WC651_05065 [Candidatus Gracilibacteria bacterium]|jgi:hypothetical protein
MINPKTRLLIISILNLDGKVLTTNDWADSLGEWLDGHPKHVIQQVIEIDPGYFGNLKVKKGRSGLIAQIEMPKTVPTVTAAPIPAPAVAVKPADPKKK